RAVVRYAGRHADGLCRLAGGAPPSDALAVAGRAADLAAWTHLVGAPEHGVPAVPQRLSLGWPAGAGAVACRRRHPRGGHCRPGFAADTPQDADDSGGRRGPLRADPTRLRADAPPG